MARIISAVFSILAFVIGIFGNAANIGKPYKTFENVPYGCDEQQKVDVYLPKNADKEIGLMVFVHSGAWISGYRSEFKRQMQQYAEQLGIAAASVGYRFTGGDTAVTSEDMLDDITAAVKAAQTVAAANGVSFDSMALYGLSAGAHLSLLYAYKCADTSPVPIAYVVSNAGPSDFTNPAYFTADGSGGVSAVLPIGELCGAELSRGLDDAETVRRLKAASPITYVGSGSVPTVLAHGDCDSVVPYSDSAALAARLAEAGVDHYLFTYHGVDHLLTGETDNDADYNALLLRLANEYLR